MKKKLFILLAATMLLILVSIPASATPPDTIGGNWSYLPIEDIFLKEVGGNLFLYTYEVSTFSGDIVGEATDQGVVVIYRSGRLSFNGTVSIESATVQGKTGPLEMRVNGTKPDLTADSIWQGYWVISSAGGGLAGLQGQGTWYGPGWQEDEPNTPGELEYTGKIHFEP